MSGSTSAPPLWSIVSRTRGGPKSPLLASAYPGLVSLADAFDFANIDAAGGDPVSQWPAGQGVSRALATGANVWKAPLVGTNPTYRSAGIGASIPGVEFTSANPTDVLFLPMISDKVHGAGGGGMSENDYSLSSVPGYTAIVVVKPTAVNTNKQILVSQFPSSLSQFNLFSNGAGLWRVTARRLASDSSSTIDAGTHVVGTPSLLHCMVDCRNRVMTTWQNGVQQATNAASVTAGVSDPGVNGSIALGGFGDGVSGADAVIGYMALWSRAYSKTALAPLLQSIASRFGISYTP